MLEYTKKIKLNKIKVSDGFKNTMPTVHKFSEKYHHFRDIKVLPDKIIVDKKYTLVDGYISYLLAKAFDWSEIEVIVRINGNADETE